MMVRASPKQSFLKGITEAAHAGERGNANGHRQ